MKKTNIQLAGKELTLNFGANYFVKYFYDSTGIDLIESAEVTFSGDIKKYEDWERFMKVICGFIYAGLMCDAKLTKYEPALNYDEISDAVYSMSSDEAGKLFAEVMKAFTPGEN